MAEEVFLLNKDNINLVKEKIVNILYKKGMPQSKIADILNISQPMVSIYCKSEKKTSNDIIEISQKIADKIIEEKKVIFKTCIIFSNKIFNGNYFIADKNEILTDENSKIIENLKSAFYILKEKNLSGLIPKIKINIAISKENPKNSDDVASFLDGLIIADNKITGYNGIRFGKSKHLSSILIKHKKDFNANTIMNIAYNKRLIKTNFKIGFLNKDFNLKEPNINYDILIHKGDFGIEPCAYILGKDAIDVADKLLKILSDIKNEK